MSLSRDHEPAITGGRGNPTLAITDATLTSLNDIEGLAQVMFHVEHPKAAWSAGRARWVWFARSEAALEWFHTQPHSNMLERAIFIAVGAHHGQLDKGSQPYILHVLRVMQNVQRPVDKVVAALHDLLEDCPTWDSLRLRQEGFSEEVIAAVVALTRFKNETYDAFILRVAENDIARRVKLADLADNSDLSRIPSPGPRDHHRARKYARATVALSSAPPGDGLGRPQVHQ